MQGRVFREGGREKIAVKVLMRAKRTWIVTDRDCFDEGGGHGWNTAVVSWSKLV